MQCKTTNSHVKSFFLSTKISFSKISFFQNFVLFYFIKKNSKKIFDEQCSNSDSETILSPKTSWMHQVHSLLASQPTQVRTGAPKRSRLAVSQPGPPAVSQRKGCRVAGARRRVVGAWPSHVAGLAGLYCDTSQPCLLFPGHNTAYCIAVQFLQPSSFWSQYNLCIAIQCPQPSSLPQSQYTNCIAIQFSTASLLQYNFRPLHTHVAI